MTGRAKDRKWNPALKNYSLRPANVTVFKETGGQVKISAYPFKTVLKR